VTAPYQTRQIAALTGVRGLAALWVAAYHGVGSLSPGLKLPSLLANLVNAGWLAVDLFFVLSGFVISYAHMRDFRTSSTESTRRFLKLRLARIYPAHFAVALLWLPLIGAAHLTHHGLSASVLQSFNPRTLGYALTLMNGWGLRASQGWNLPAWSVGSEWFAYLTFPLVAGGLWRIRTASGMMLIAATTLLLATALAIIVNGGHHYMLPESFTLVRVETEFLVGCCAYGIYCRLPLGSRATWLSWAGTSGCVALACSGRHGLLDGLFIPLFFLLILGLSYARGRLALMLALPGFVHLGKISYSIYLIHAMIIVILRQALPVLGGFGSKHPLVIGVIYFALVVAAGHVLYRAIEEPARTYLRRAWVEPTP
jgi:peptidoglycan/LPS O-acetylase OafA/YrhL